MAYSISSSQLTHAAVLEMMHAAVSKAEEIGQPQCIVIVDASGETLGQLRMTGAKFLSLKSARSKARTAASNRTQSAAIPQDFRTPIAFATGGEVTGLPGGLPIKIEDDVVGGIGIGSGTSDQDIAVGNAALAAIGAETFS